MDEETEQLDDSLVNIKSDISELTNGKISIMKDADTYKSTYQILKEISEIWDDLTDKQQAGLLEKLFGKTRAQIGAAILQNFQAAENAVTKMTESAGNADAEMEIITQSLEYKLNALKETGTGIIQNLFPRDAVGNAIESLTSILEVIDKITETLGPGGTLATLAGAGGLVAIIKNFGKHIALYSREAVLQKPSNCGEPLIPFCHSAALTGNREGAERQKEVNGWPMLNNNAVGF